MLLSEDYGRKRPIPPTHDCVGADGLQTAETFLLNIAKCSTWNTIGRNILTKRKYPKGKLRKCEMLVQWYAANTS